jgi:hypothetical protein
VSSIQIDEVLALITYSGYSVIDTGLATTVTPQNAYAWYIQIRHHSSDQVRLSSITTKTMPGPTFTATKAASSSMVEPTSEPSPTAMPATHHLSVAAKAGIGVGVAFSLVLFAFLFAFCVWKRRQGRGKPNPSPFKAGKTELEGNTPQRFRRLRPEDGPPYEVHSNQIHQAPPPLMYEAPSQEPDGRTNHQEASPTLVQELPTQVLYSRIQ